MLLQPLCREREMLMQGNFCTLTDSIPGRVWRGSKMLVPKRTQIIFFFSSSACGKGGFDDPNCDEWLIRGKIYMINVGSSTVPSKTLCISTYQTIYSLTALEGKLAILKNSSLLKAKAPNNNLNLIIYTYPPTNGGLAIAGS